MLRRNLAIMASAAMLFAACGATTTATDAGGANSEMSNLITVSGTGEATGVPDTLVIDLGVSLLAPTVAEATSRSAAMADGILSALRANGVADEDIQTTNYSISPEYDYSGNTQRLTGYRVVNTVSAKIRDIDSAGNVIDAATGAGGDSVVVNGVRFDVEHDADMMTAARESAWNDAHQKAVQLSELAGVTLGRAVSIAETTAGGTPPIVYERAMLAADSATPIAPGTQAVSVTVTVSFEIG